MTVQELYTEIGDYEEAKKHLMNDRLIGKFVVKFPGDPSFSQLVDAWEKRDEDAIFKAAHAMKGVCANLALSGLSVLVEQVTEEYRPGQTKQLPAIDMPEVMAKLQEQYKKVVSAIEQYQNA